MALSLIFITQKEFKEPLTENFVLQQLYGQFDVNPRFYADRNIEIDFIVQNGTQIIPIEVKGGEDKGAASFKTYIPLYLVGMTKKLI